MQISFLIPVLHPQRALINTVQTVVKLLASFSFDTTETEILICLNPIALSNDESNILDEIRDLFPTVNILSPGNNHGKGAAVKQGIVHSKGKYIFFTDDDLPYNLNFFSRAKKELDTGADWVVGNRRNSASTLELNESCRNFFLRRAFVGTLFNSMTRRLLRLKIQDTQAGIKAYKREFALLAVSQQRCEGFLFDVEHFLVAKNRDLSVVDLPVEHHVVQNESSIRLRKELPKAIAALFKIVFQNYLGFYSEKSKNIQSDQIDPISQIETGTA